MRSGKWGQSLQANKTVAPFLKWAGGKRWLVDRHGKLFPDFCGRYIEPFLGGGSVFFHLRPKNAIISDLNSELILCYTQIRDDPKALQSLLAEHQASHCTEYYYQVRSQNLADATERAARFIYLNRTCWNGLYRVNAKGDFNVPIGTKSKILYHDSEFSDVSEALSGVDISARDFEETINEARNGDLVFVDPPYTVKHNFNGFLKYNENIFSWNDQLRLRDSVQKAAERGASVIVTNAAHSSIYDLYRDIGEIHTLDRQSVLAGNRQKRGPVQEIVVRI